MALTELTTITGVGIHTQSNINSHAINSTGIITATGVNVNGDLDVDGHINLDNVSISGVVTATKFIGDGSDLTSLPAGLGIFTM